VPWNLKLYFQKFLVKVGSCSETIEWGIPWSLNILSMKTLAMVDVVNCVGQCKNEHIWKGA
jgi:hypothetical protein